MDSWSSNQSRYGRRQALRHLAVFSAAGFLAACSRKPSCTDVTGLNPDEVTQRLNTAAYTEPAADPAKKCSACAQFLPSSGCGTCKVVKGPVSPDGGCKLWVAVNG